MILLVGALALVIYIFVSPLNMIALFPSFKKRRNKSQKDVMAVNSQPKIRIEYNVSPKEKSKLIKEMKYALDNLINEKDSVNPNERDRDPDQMEIPYIPDDDEENPDLVVEDEEGPEIREDEGPKEEAGDIVEYVRLKDL